jgi:hypothetical protein
MAWGSPAQRQAYESTPEYLAKRKRRRDEAKAAGKCGQCRKRLSLPGLVYCAECRLSVQNYNRRRNAHKTKRRCGFCGMPGHYAVTCPSGGCLVFQRTGKACRSCQAVAGLAASRPGTPR